MGQWLVHLERPFLLLEIIGLSQGHLYGCSRKWWNYHDHKHHELALAIHEWECKDHHVAWYDGDLLDGEERDVPLAKPVDDTATTFIEVMITGTTTYYTKICSFFQEGSNVEFYQCKQKEGQ